MSNITASHSCREITKYKTELCRNWLNTGTCQFMQSCIFSHGEQELRAKTDLHPKYKTQLCHTYYNTGKCPYGNRCQFLHSRVSKYKQQLDEIAALNQERLRQHMAGIYSNLGNFKRLQLFREISSV